MCGWAVSGFPPALQGMGKGGVDAVYFIPSQFLQDFSCHCREISSKVMAIMDELITKQLAKVY